MANRWSSSPSTAPIWRRQTCRPSRPCLTPCARATLLCWACSRRPSRPPMRAPGWRARSPILAPSQSSTPPPFPARAAPGFPHWMQARCRSFRSPCPPQRATCGPGPNAACRPPTWPCTWSFRKSMGDCSRVCRRSRNPSPAMTTCNSRATRTGRMWRAPKRLRTRSEGGATLPALRRQIATSPSCSAPIRARTGTWPMQSALTRSPRPKRS